MLLKWREHRDKETGRQGNKEIMKALSIGFPAILLWTGHFCPALTSLIIWIPLKSAVEGEYGAHDALVGKLLQKKRRESRA
jgi:hypothetical protein